MVLVVVREISLDVSEFGAVDARIVFWRVEWIFLGSLCGESQRFCSLDSGWFEAWNWLTRVLGLNRNSGFTAGCRLCGGLT